MRAGGCLPWKYVYLILFIALAALGGTRHAAAMEAAESLEVSEYEMKAAYLYNFAKFVEWPSYAFADKNSPILIGIVGNDPFGYTLDLVISNKTIGERPLIVRRLTWPADLHGYHIIFLSSYETQHMPQITSSLQGIPVLIITEMPRSLGRGSIVNFVMEGNKVKFEIDVGNADKVGLKISSKLLMLARVYRNGKPEGRN
jgi:hypothetical protein